MLRLLADINIHMKNATKNINSWHEDTVSRGKVFQYFEILVFFSHPYNKVGIAVLF